MVKLYNELNGEIIGDVEYNENLDSWDGRNYSNGGVGMHKGFGYLEEEDQFYIIIGSQWQGSQDYAYICSEEELIREMIDSDNSEEIEKYPELQEVYERDFITKKQQKSKVFSIRIKIDESKKEIEKKITEMRKKISEFI
jgi:hypothetical protein